VIDVFFTFYGFLSSYPQLRKRFIGAIQEKARGSRIKRRKETERTPRTELYRRLSEEYPQHTLHLIVLLK
jgi:hypothetical protein